MPAAKRLQCIGLAVSIDELDLEGVRVVDQNDSPDLASSQNIAGYVCSERNNVEELNLIFRPFHTAVMAQNG